MSLTTVRRFEVRLPCRIFQNYGEKQKQTNEKYDRNVIINHMCVIDLCFNLTPNSPNVQTEVNRIKTIISHYLTENNRLYLLF